MTLYLLDAVHDTGILSVAVSFEADRSKGAGK